MPAITLENVCKSFGPTCALRGISMVVRNGERVALLGPSGSGKTTLLRLICGLDMPTSGVVRIGSAPPTLTNGAPGPAAMVFQNLALFPHLTAFDNIALGLRAQKVPRNELRARISEIADVLVITRLLDRRPHQLSAGERQRVALARALVKRPSVLLLDEPFANIDSHLRAELREELKRVHARFNMTMICVTHDLLEAFTLGQRIAVLNHGLLEQFDTPAELLENPASPFVKSFLALPAIPEMARQLLRERARGATVEHK